VCVVDLALPASILPKAHEEQLTNRVKMSANFFMAFHYNYQASSNTRGTI
jgi:hypothetical protein